LASIRGKIKRIPADSSGDDAFSAIWAKKIGDMSVLKAQS
jgi:hypothetical protein